jgi:Cu(I)/Ag(I) efflux system membrane fusion protein
MTLDYLPDRQWKGKVDYVYPSLDSKSRTLRVRLRFDNSDGLLKPNMYAQVVIQVAFDMPVVAVVREAVIRTGTQDRLVLALGDGYYKSIEVELGRMTQEYVEILDGLEEGEVVVTSAQFLLDSESSKTSDFKRMHHGDVNVDTELPDSDAIKAELDMEMVKDVGLIIAETVWVAAEIKSAMRETRMVSAYHQPIPDWQWPSMTINFLITEVVEFDQLQVGTQLHMQIGMRDDGQYVIVAVHILSQPDLDIHSVVDAESIMDIDQSQHQMMRKK